MGEIVSAVGHLCIDLSHVELSGNDQQALLEAVQRTVIAHLARVASNYKVITISLSPNNGQRQKPIEDPPAPDQPSEPETPPPATTPPDLPQRRD